MQIFNVLHGITFHLLKVSKPGEVPSSCPSTTYHQDVSDGRANRFKNQQSASEENHPGSYA